MGCDRKKVLDGPASPLVWTSYSQTVCINFHSTNRFDKVGITDAWYKLLVDLVFARLFQLILLDLFFYLSFHINKVRITDAWYEL